MSTETLSRGALFAQMQSECLRLGVKPNADLSGLQAIAKAMCDAAADEAVAAATIFVTEVEIAEACNQFAEDELRLGRLSNGYRLKDAASAITTAARLANREDVKAALKLSSAQGELPPAISKRVEAVGRLIAPKKAADFAPLRRLVAILIGEAHEAGYHQGTREERDARRAADSDRQNEILRDAGRAVEQAREMPGEAPPPPLGRERDMHLAEWLEAYATALCEPGRKPDKFARVLAASMTRDILAGVECPVRRPLRDRMMRARGCETLPAFRAYLASLYLGPVPDADRAGWEKLQLDANGLHPVTAKG